jgi:hypothetical protein
VAATKPVSQSMKFFIPGVQRAQSEAVYKALFDTAKDQLRTPISPKRILSVRYIHDKREVVLKIGEPHPQNYRYVVMAIFESQPHIVVTQSSSAKPGPTFMVNSAEITEVTEFEE